MGDVASLSSRCAACVLCVGSANEIPLQNSSTFNKFCCPYLGVSSSPRRRRVCWTLLGLLCLLCCMLCERADGFAAAFMKVIGATRALLRVLLELQIGVLGNLQHSSPRGSSLKLRFLARELSKLVWHACFRRDRGNLKLGQNPGESHAVCHNLHALLPYAVSLLTNTCRGSHR